MVVQQTESTTSQQGAAQQAGAAAASQTSQTEGTQAQHETGTAQASTQEAPARPDWLPEQLWDGEKKAPKADDLKGLLDAKKADDERRAALPKTAAEYKTELSADFELPDGWEIAANDPRWAAAKEIAHKHGLSQEALSAFATAAIKNDIAHHDALTEAAKARDASLGANGGARIEALNTFFKGAFGDKVGAQLSTTLFSKDIVEAFEKMQGALASQGVTSFSGIGRQGEPPAGQIQGYEKMSFEQRRAAQDAARRAAN